jgi:hypothetical protein
MWPFLFFEGAMLTLKVMLAAAMAIAMAVPSYGYFENGNDLYSACEYPDQSFCLGYILGAVDVNRWHVPIDQLMCIPPEVIGSQIKDVVHRYLMDNPETRQESAPTLIYKALVEAWPC